MNGTQNRTNFLIALVLVLLVGFGAYVYSERERPCCPDRPAMACRNGECVGHCCQIPTEENGRLVTKHAPWCECTRRGCKHCR